MGEEDRRLEVVVPDEQLSLAIGRKGQNVRLACELTGISIDILTETVESQRRSADVAQKSQLFTEALTIDDVMARLLVAEGFESLEEIAFVPPEDFLTIEGFTQELVQELQKRAASYLENKNKGHLDRFRELGGDPSLETFENIPSELLPLLAEKEVFSLQDFSDLSGDELKEIAGALLTQEQADQLIMEARKSLAPHDIEKF
jgi:N utilization substance protein A